MRWSSSRYLVVAMAVCVAVGGVCFLLGRMAGVPAVVPAPAAPEPAPDPNAALRRELASLKGALESSEQQRAALQAQLQERTSALWDLVAEFWRQQGAPQAQPYADLDHTWNRAMDMTSGGLFSSGENPQPWLFYDSFADGIACMVEVARQGEAAVLFLESVVARPKPEFDLAEEAPVDPELPESAEASSDGADDDGSAQDVEPDSQEDALKRWEKERGAALEFLGELASRPALEALLRLRKRFPDDPEITALNRIHNHVEHMPTDQIQPYLSQTLEACRETLKAGRGDGMLDATTAYLAFRHNLPAAANLLRSPQFLSLSCAGAANVAADAHTDAGFRYLRWLAATSRDAGTVEVAQSQLASWGR